VRTAVIFSPSGVLRAGLEALLEEIGRWTVVGQAATAEQLRERVRDSAPDLVVADLPGRSGEGIEQVVEQSAAVVILSDQDLSWSAPEPNGGGRAILGRDASAEKIAAAVEAAASGLIVLDTNRAPTPASAAAVAPRRPDTVAESMTPREVQVLTMIGEGLGNKTIAYRLGISEHTVKFHVGSIMRKLDASSRTEAVTTGVRQGLISV
jgi:DNA-binding NarL/FixJ family response regulator